MSESHDWKSYGWVAGLVIPDDEPLLIICDDGFVDVANLVAALQ